MKNPKQENDIIGVVDKSRSNLTLISQSAYDQRAGDEVIPWKKLVTTLTKRGYRPQINWVIFHVSIQQFQPTDVSYLFADMENLTALDGIGRLDVSQATSTRGMFQNCKQLVELDLHAFDTGKVADMRDMFRGCTSLLDLYLSPQFEIGFTDNNYMEIQSMFQGCQSHALAHLMTVQRDSRGVPFWTETNTMKFQDFSEAIVEELTKEVQHDKV